AAPELAGAAVLDELVTRGGGTGGVIAVTPRGDVLAAHASETMSYAAIVGEADDRREAAGSSTRHATLRSTMDCAGRVPGV
ncbi:MAG: hypothetical protein K8M05_12210, partial [Deltaproteobacteria bacterium]|nr:hypothetical protein [Kofleriaceae bacterium]